MCSIGAWQTAAQEGQETPEPATVETDRYGFEMIYVPAGSFEMGITRQQFHDYIVSGALGDVPDSQVDLVEDIAAGQGVFEAYTATIPAFWIDRYEVTIEQYTSLTEVCIGTGRCSRIDLSRTPELASDPNQPQVKVTWFDAMRFCNGRGARLPSEEEWEYTASGPDNRLFPWGDTFVPDHVSTENTYPVGTRAGNVSWIGAYDMAGNAGEWVENHLKRYTPLSQEQSDILPIESDVQRVIRGGSYRTTVNFLTTFARSSDHPDTQGVMGIRCARSSDPRTP
jgi:iron(II)-dependent oxidoreductase